MTWKETVLDFEFQYPVVMAIAGVCIFIIGALDFSNQPIPAVLVMIAGGMHIAFGSTFTYLVLTDS